MHGSRDISLQSALRSGRVGPGRAGSGRVGPGRAGSGRVAQCEKFPLVDDELARPSASLVTMFYHSINNVAHNPVVTQDNTIFCLVSLRLKVEIDTSRPLNCYRYAYTIYNRGQRDKRCKRAESAGASEYSGVEISYILGTTCRGLM